MSDEDPAERWRELDESTQPRARSRARSRGPSDPPARPRPAPEPTRLRGPEPRPESGPSPYEAYPWAAVGGSPLSPTQAPFPAPSPYGVPGPGRPPVPFPVQHPSASVALTLGLVATLGGAACWAPLLASPVALTVGRRALREIDASQGTLTGRGAAKAGAVLGGIGTVALVALVVALIVFVAG